MPSDTPQANVIEYRELGAQVTMIDGLITDCGAEIARRKEADGWFDTCGRPLKNLQTIASAGTS